MARWKNIHATFTVRADALGNDPTYEIAPGEIGDIPEQWTPWLISRGYPLERVDAPPPALPAEPEATPAVVAPVTKATPAAPTGAVVISDGDAPAPADGAPAKTPVDRRGARAKATPAGG